ncbi:hypothetical protein N7504_004170 [Penicillium tannophilum]|nr:hypothetical protein N7504_004170 [Penicillium tannophilum]
MPGGFPQVDMREDTLPKWSSITCSISTWYFGARVNTDADPRTVRADAARNTSSGKPVYRNRVSSICPQTQSEDKDTKGERGR